MTAERRLERLRPAEVAALVERAPVAWVPIGPIEYHGPHLPLGVDAFEAHGLCLRAAGIAGGVVLPPSHVACGALDLPWTLDYPPAAVDAWAAPTLDGLARRGFRVVVVVTGHGPLDLIHRLKRLAAEAEARSPGLRVYALCWLELNAARMTAPDPGEPTVVDHAALVETSWMLHLRPDLVDTALLPDDPEATTTGVYGRNPRFTATEAFGARQVADAAELLAGRATRLLEGGTLDPLADLRRFVEHSWPEPLELRDAPAGEAGGAIGLHNPGRASRYLSAVTRLTVAGRDVAAGAELVNTNAGETGVAAPVAALGPESGFYVRRGQTAVIRLAEPVTAGTHPVELTVGLGGVTEGHVRGDVRFA